MAADCLLHEKEKRKSALFKKEGEKGSFQMGRIFPMASPLPWSVVLFATTPEMLEVVVLLLVAFVASQGNKRVDISII